MWIALLLLCAIGAAAALRRIVILGLPAAADANRFAGVDVHFAARSGPTLLHIVPSLLFVLLIPLQFVSSIRLRHTQWHRWTGRTIMALGIVIGLSALRLSIHSVGGLVESAATILFGCSFLLALGKAWWHIRRRRIALHREWAICMTAFALGVATTRPVMGFFFATSRLTGLKPEQFFGPAMWIGFLATWLAAETYIKSRTPA